MNHQNLRSLTLSVNKMLSANEQPALVTIEICAEQLAMSTTSFRRKLAQENSSFKLIQQKYLNELCVNALLTDNIKIDKLAYMLGYSERATFERAFKNKYGITPSQFRELNLGNNRAQTQKNITNIIESLPVLSTSAQQLINAKQADNLDIMSTIKIVSADPLLSARIIGIASKAIYGKTPKNLHEAISRNLGISSVINLAVLHSVEKSINSQIDDELLHNALNTCSIAPQLLKVFKKCTNLQTTLESQLTEQVLMFGLLGLFVLCHKQNAEYKLAMHSISGIDDLTSLNIHLYKSTGHTLFSASAMMLSLWHLDALVIKALTHLNKVTLQAKNGDHNTKQLQFMLECLFQTLKKEKNIEMLEQKAELLEIGGFESIKQLL